MESSLYLLVPLSVALVFLIGWVFWRALHGGQFDDLDRPGYSILEDDDLEGNRENRGQSPASVNAKGDEH